MRGLLNEAVIAELESVEGVVLADQLSQYFKDAAAHVIELNGAIGRAETLRVGRTAHKLKGSSRTLGAVRIAHLASDLEAMAAARDLVVADKLLDKLRTGLDETREAFRKRAAAPSPAA